MDRETLLLELKKFFPHWKGFYERCKDISNKQLAFHLAYERSRVPPTVYEMSEEQDKKKEEREKRVKAHRSLSSTLGALQQEVKKKDLPSEKIEQLNEMMIAMKKKVQGEPSVPLL